MESKLTRSVLILLRYSLVWEEEGAVVHMNIRFPQVAWGHL